jgi:hypothetical protein
VALRRIAIGALLVSLVVGMASNLLFLAAFEFRIDWFFEPTLILGAGTTSAALLRWASVLDLFGYYLATAALAYVLWRILRRRNPAVADLATVAAIGYALIGGAGAAVLAKVGPMLMNDYVTATSPVEQQVIAVHFAVLFEVVWRSIWQFLDGILIAAWWLGIGVLSRRDHASFSRLSYVLAAIAAAFSVLNALGVDLARDAALGVVFTLWTAWWVWLLVLFLRRPEQDLLEF